MFFFSTTAAAGAALVAVVVVGLSLFSFSFYTIFSIFHSSGCNFAETQRTMKRKINKQTRGERDRERENENINTNWAICMLMHKRFTMCSMHTTRSYSNCESISSIFICKRLQFLIKLNLTVQCGVVLSTLGAVCIRCKGRTYTIRRPRQQQQHHQQLRRRHSRQRRLVTMEQRHNMISAARAASIVY